MQKKVVDLLNYKIEKYLKENGFEVKKDSQKNVKILVRIRTSD